MKKLNLKSVLAWLLTLCLLLGGMASLAEEDATTDAGGLVPPVTIAPDAPVVIAPDAPEPIETSVEAFAGETAGQVNVIVSDISSTNANTGLEIRAYANTDDDGKVTSTGDSLKINDSDALLSDEDKKLIEGANELFVYAGPIAENLSKPVEVKEAMTDGDGNAILDENGEPEYSVSYRDSVTALNITTQWNTSNEKIDVTTSDLYAVTTATSEGDEESYAEAFNIYNDGKGNTVNLEVGGGIYVDVERPEANVEHGFANAWGPYANVENGSTSEVDVDDLIQVNASSKEKSAEVGAYAVTGYASGDGSRLDIATYTVATTATASGEDSEAEARALRMYSSGKSEAKAIVFGTSAEATSPHNAKAVGIYGQSVTGGAVDIFAIGDTDATALLSGDENAANPGKDTHADATGIKAQTANGTVDILLIGDVEAISSEDATGVKVEASSSDLIWDSEEDKYVGNTMPGAATVEVSGGVFTVGSASVVGVDVNARAASSYNEETGEYEQGGLAGKANVLIDGNVLAVGPENHEDADHIIAVNVSGADPNAEVNVAVIGDATAAGKDATGLDVTASKGSKVDVLVTGRVSGDGKAIGVERSSREVYVDSEGNPIPESESLEEFDPTAANIYVWEAVENKDGRIVEVYDWLNTGREVKKTGEDGKEIVEYTYEPTYTVDEAASAKLEQAIWYIVGVKEKWQKRITATGTGAYTLDDTAYQLAHQDDDVTLSIKLPSGKKLKAIMYGDGTKAEYVKNEDGTYTVKMKRGGAMELALKLKSKNSAASDSTGEAVQGESAAAALTDAQAVNGVKASDRPELVKAMKAIGESIDGKGAKVSVPGAQKLLSEGELSAFDVLNAKDRLLVTLCAMGFADEVNAMADGLSADGRALADAIAARIAGMTDDEKKALEGAIAEQFPKGAKALDGVARDTFRFDMTVENGGAKENDRYTFFDDNGTWRLCDIETIR